HRAACDDEEPRRPHDAVLRRRSRADAGWLRVYPRHALGAHLSRDESVRDRRRRGGDHEGPRGTAAWMVRMSDSKMEAKLRQVFEEHVPFNKVIGLKVESTDPDAP